MDCTVRALSKALGLTWDQAYVLLTAAGYELKRMPSSAAVWSYVLRLYGWRRRIMPDQCPVCYSFADFAEDHPRGRYVLASGDHVAAIEDGTLWDSWDSSGEIVQLYWSP